MNLDYGVALNQLGGVTCITGDLRVSNSNLTDLTGLEYLVAVGGNVDVSFNPVLTSFKGLQNLKSAGRLIVAANRTLTSLAELGNLKTLHNGHSIADNPLLPACWTWQIAQQTGTRCDFCPNNTGNGSCGSLPEGFVCQPGAIGPGVYDGYVRLDDWTRPNQFGGVTCITGDLMAWNSNLTDLTGLEYLVAVGGNVDISNNPTLSSLKGLDQLRSAGSLIVRDNPALTNLSNIGSLTTLRYNASIANNLGLPACWTWQIAQQTGTRCDYCQNNTGDGSCGTLPEGFVCQPGAIGPGVYDGYVRLDDWTRPNQFGGVTCITGDLVAWNSSLTDLTGLVQLVAVGGNVTIDNNPALVSVTGLENLKTAAGLWINYNPLLTSLAGLNRLNSLRNDPSIYGNPLLPACWAENVAMQTGRLCACSGNTGEGVCQ